MKKFNAFFAYSSAPSEIGHTIERAIQLAGDSNELAISSWKALDIVGQFIAGEVLNEINSSYDSGIDCSQPGS